MRRCTSFTRTGETNTHTHTHTQRQVQHTNMAAAEKEKDAVNLRVFLVLIQPSFEDAAALSFLLAGEQVYNSSSSCVISLSVVSAVAMDTQQAETAG